MKKLFGLFAVGAAALTLASCDEDEVVNQISESDLPGLFQSAFSNSGLSSIGGATTGTYAFNIESMEDDSYYDDYLDETIYSTIYYDLTASMSFGPNGLVFDLNVDGEFNSTEDVQGDQDTFSARVVADQTDLYLNYLVSTTPGIEESFIDELLYNYDYLFEGVNADDYDYAKFSYDDIAPLLEAMLGDIPVLDITNSDLSGIFAGLEGFEHSLSDFMIDEFTTYQLVSQTEAYATVNFELFDEASYELMFDLFNNISQVTSGVAISDEEFRAEWDSVAEEYADLAIKLEFGINPTSGVITKVGLDTKAFYEARGFETFFNFEYTYTESNTVISVPTDRVLDANAIIPVIIEEIEEANKEVASEYFC